VSDNVIKTLVNLRDESAAALDRLVRWKALGGELDSYPDGLTIEDMIRREDQAVKRLNKAIETLQAASSKPVGR